MHQLIRLFIFSVSIFTKAHASIIITDIDDTIKRSESLIPALAVSQFIINPDDQFYGTRRLIEDLVTVDFNSRIYYISNSYQDVFKASDWLQKNAFPQGEIYQQKNINEILFKNDQPSNEQHKHNALSAIYKRDNDIFSRSEEIYFFGDNGYQDEEIYTGFIRDNAIKKANIFIRDIRGVSFSVLSPLLEPIMLSQQRSVNERGNLYLFKNESEFWFDLKYDFLVQKTTLLTWWTWYIGWHKRNLHSKVLTQLLFEKYYPIACKKGGDKEKKEDDSFCRIQLTNQITRQLAQMERPLF